MADALSELGVEFEKVDVDGDPALSARYGRSVPVLTDGAGREICRIHLDAQALRARLALE